MNKDIIRKLEADFTMTINSPNIMAGDEQWDIEYKFIKICGLNIKEYMENEKILNKNIFEKNFKNLIEFVESEKSHIAYQVLGVFILKTGSKLTNYLRKRIIESTRWIYDKENEWPHKWLKLRKFYLYDLRKKIMNHKECVRTYVIDLKILNDMNFNSITIGSEQFKAHYQNGTLNSKNYINLDCCQLKVIPEVIFKIDSLEIISLENNELKSLPASIKNCKTLKRLYLANNKIITLPESIGDLQNLEVLSLNDNRLETIPESLGKLNSLKSITLKRNKIKAIPKSFKNLKKKCFINIEKEVKDIYVNYF